MPRGKKKKTTTGGCGGKKGKKKTSTKDEHDHEHKEGEKEGACCGSCAKGGPCSGAEGPHSHPHDKPTEEASSPPHVSELSTTGTELVLAETSDKPKRKPPSRKPRGKAKKMKFTEAGVPSSTGPLVQDVSDAGAPVTLAATPPPLSIRPYESVFSPQSLFDLYPDRTPIVELMV